MITLIKCKRIGMGFPTYMDQVDAGAPMPFTGKFLKYHLLKDRLKVVVSSPSQAERDAGEQAFLADLQVQLYDINRCAFTHLRKLCQGMQ